MMQSNVVPPIVFNTSLKQYLLEKSRLVWQSEQERNYHVFYYMLAGMSSEEKARLGLTKPSDYQYLSQDNLNKALSNKCYAKGQGSCLRLVSKIFKKIGR